MNLVDVYIKFYSLLFLLFFLHQNISILLCFSICNIGCYSFFNQNNNFRRITNLSESYIFSMHKTILTWSIPVCPKVFLMEHIDCRCKI